MNAMNRPMWLEIGKCFSDLGDNPDCRVIILSGAGKLFTAGIDFGDFAQMASIVSDHDDVARRCKAFRTLIKTYQDSLSSLEKCCKPVICAVHNVCLGAGVDLITAADIRLCTKDAWFQVKEVDVGMAADVGTLQRLPKVTRNESLIRELALTGRRFDSTEAKECGLVSQLFEDKDRMIDGAIKLASEIASKSPVATQVTKRSIVFSRDHTVQEGLDHIRDWNMAMLQSEDFMKATMAQATKSPPLQFAKL
ncbi:delta(3,5)-Delta(2,4)-dienoyl-CoA isomerase, mitochondrial isoform X2 [Anabrus simplex]